MNTALNALSRSPLAPEVDAELNSIASSIESIAKSLSEVVAHRNTR